MAIQPRFQRHQLIDRNEPLPIQAMQPQQPFPNEIVNDRCGSAQQKRGVVTGTEIPPLPFRDVGSM